MLASYTYDARSQLRGITDSAGPSVALDYDAQGNLLRKERGADVTVFGWNSRDLLTTVTRNSVPLARYGSNHAGLRVSKEALDPLQPGAPPQLILTQWDDENAVQDRVEGVVVTRYDFAHRQAVAMWSLNSAQLLHADALRSVVVTTSADGTVVSETLYDAWGLPIVRQGFSVNKFAYTGHQYDAETALYYFKARYYDPELGRFISEDPAGGSEGQPASYHRYLYAYANPLAYWDPDGRVQELVDAADKLNGANQWLRERAALCEGGGLVCALAAGSIGVTRAFVSAGEAAVRTVNVVANIHTLMLAQSGLIPQDRVAASVTELEGTANAVKTTLKVLSTEEGREAVVDGLKQTIEKVKNGDAGAISDVVEGVAGSFIGGSGALKAGNSVRKAAGEVVKDIEHAAAREALSGTRTAAHVVGETAEATATKPLGRVLTESSSGPGVETVASRTVRSVEAEVPSQKMVDLPMGRSAGAASVSRRRYIEANSAEMRAGNDSSAFLDYARRERTFAAKGVIEPSTVRFSQDSAKAAFSRGGSIQEMADALRSGALKAYQVPAIRLVEKDGRLFTLDNRRLEAFRRAEMDVPYRMATPQETAREGWKFTTRNGGMTIRIRGE